MGAHKHNRKQTVRVPKRSQTPRFGVKRTMTHNTKKARKTEKQQWRRDNDL